MAQNSEDGQFERQMLPGTALSITSDVFCNSTMRGITGSAMAVSLDNQRFYNPIVATRPEPASRGPLLRKGNPSAASFGAPLHPPPPLQDAHDPQRGSAGKSQPNAILIPSDGESDDDLDDGRSDTSYPPLEELLAAAHNKVQSGSVVSTGKSVDAAPDESDAPELSVTSGPGPDDESANQQRRRDSLGPSLGPSSSSPETVPATQTQPVPAGCAAFEPGQASAPANTSRDTTVPETDAASLAEHGATRHDHGMQHRPRPSEKPYRTTSNHDGSIYLDNDSWDRRFPFSHQALQRRLQARRAAKSAYNGAEADQSQSTLDPHCRPHGPRPAASGHGGELQQTSDNRCLYRGDSDQTSNSDHRHLDPDDKDQNGVCPAVPPQAEESRASTPTLPNADGISELELADAEPRLRLHSPGSAAPSLEAETQQRSDSCCLSQHHDQRGDSVRTSDLEHRHPQVPDDGGEQDEESSVVPSQAQESRAGMPSLSGDESGNEGELANTAPSIRLSASQNPVNIQRIGCRRRRRDTADKEDCSPIAGSNAKQGKDKDAVQPPRGKRRRVNTSAPTTRRTAPKRQTRLRRTDSPSLQAQSPPPAQGLKRRQSQRSISKPRSSAGSALEEETVSAAFAGFEEWPLDAVLKRAWVDGVATFQIEFRWHPCTNHGRNDRPPENPQRKSLVGRTSSTGRSLPSRIASTAEEVQGDEYFEVEDIRGWRQGEEGREYLVKWAGYGDKHNTWEPAAHLEQCPEILQQFHQRAGL